MRPTRNRSVADRRLPLINATEQSVGHGAADRAPLKWKHYLPRPGQRCVRIETYAMSRFFVPLLVLMYAGCAESARTPNRSDRESNFDPSASTFSDEELRASLGWSRFPDEQQGNWLEGDEAQKAVTLTDISLRLQEAPPPIGFVPLWCQGHTLLGTVTNHYRHLVADVELTVIAVSKEDESTLAVMNTETMIPYFITAPNESDGREVWLTNRFNQEVSPFDDIEKWPPFYLKANVRRVRVIDEAAHLSYVRRLKTEPAAYREAHKNDQRPQLDD